MDDEKDGARWNTVRNHDRNRVSELLCGDNRPRRDSYLIKQFRGEHPRMIELLKSVYEVSSRREGITLTELGMGFRREHQDS